MEKSLVIVESPAKAKTINKYLGSGYKVLASMGHVRDLSPKEGSVLPDQDFAVVWEVTPRAEQNLKLISENCKDSDKLILATDPDREGEAISWHILEILKQKRATSHLKSIERVVFHEITKPAILKAMHQPRAIDQNLVDAYMARRALDYLVGYTLSPVLWRKLPGTRSAGRVQSAALRLITEREIEITKFISEDYYSIPVQLKVKSGVISSKLTHINQEKLEVKALKSEAEAEALRTRIEVDQFSLKNIEKKQGKRNPFAPFTTSTLQQEGVRKLGFSTQKTMQIAQKLYEGVDIGGETVGLITYMRTDSTNLSMDSINAARSLIEDHFGAEYVPSSPRIYKTKAKNAQEAHEAIRPTDITRRPDSLVGVLDNDSHRLYRLIWNRMVASQMSSAQIETTNAYFANPGDSLGLTASGVVVKFDGFLALYHEGRDDKSDEDDESILPPLNEGENGIVHKTEVKKHTTEPPARFTEASLVKKLEEAGIGRPSTYATIIKVLQDREYVVLDPKKRFHPEPLGMVLSQFLTIYYEKFFNSVFTAEMEDELDDVADGKMEWKNLLSEFWNDFNKRIKRTMDLPMPDIREKLETLLDIFIKSRKCPECADGVLSLNLGRYGPFIGCKNYPNCNYRQMLKTGAANETAQTDGGSDFPKSLGVDEQGRSLMLKKGPYGVYLQRSAAHADEKAKNISLPKGIKPEDVTLTMALALSALPRLVGLNPNDNQEITADYGRFGPFLKYNGAYFNLKGDSPLEIGLNRAMEVISASAGKTAKSKGILLGEHPDGGEIYLAEGRYGPYVGHGRVFASLPKGQTSVTLEQACDLLAKKAGTTASTAKTASKTPKAAAAKKTSAKTAAAKPTATKTAARKPAAKK